MASTTMASHSLTRRCARSWPPFRSSSAALPAFLLPFVGPSSPARHAALLSIPSSSSSAAARFASSSNPAASSWSTSASTRVNSDPHDSFRRAEERQPLDGAQAKPRGARREGKSASKSVKWAPVDSKTGKRLVGFEKRTAKKLNKLKRTHELAHRSANKMAGQRPSHDIPHFDPTANFVSQSRQLQRTLQDMAVQVKRQVLEPGSAKAILERADKLTRKETRTLKILIKGVDPRFQRHRQACLNASRIRGPWNTLIQIAMLAKQAEAGYHIFQDMKKWGFMPNASTFSVLLDGLVRNQLEAHRRSSKSDTPPFNPAGKPLARARAIFAELEWLWQTALPDQYYGPGHNRRVLTPELMEKEVRENTGTDQTRIRMVSRHSSIAEVQQFPQVLSTFLNIYLRVLLLAEQYDEAWALFLKMCPRTDYPGLTTALSDRITYSTMLKGLGHINRDDHADDKAKLFGELKAIWNRWEMQIKAVVDKATTSLANAASDPSTPSSASSQESSSAGSLVEGILMMEAEALERDEEPIRAHKRIKGHDAVSAELQRILPEPAMLQVLLYRIWIARDRNDVAPAQDLTARILRTFFGLEAKRYPTVLQFGLDQNGGALDPKGTGKRPTSESPRPPPPMKLEDPDVIEGILNAISHADGRELCVLFFNYVLSLSQARDLGDPEQQRQRPLGPLITSRAIASVVSALGFARDPLAMVTLLRAARLDPSTHPSNATYRRTLKCVSFTKPTDATGQTALKIAQQGPKGYNPWALAVETFELWRQHSPRLDRDSPDATDLLRDLVLSLVETANQNRPAFEPEIDTARHALRLLHGTIPLPDLLSRLPSTFGPPRDDDPHRMAYRLQRELFITATTALRTGKNGANLASAAEVSLWKECRARLAPFKPRHEKQEEQWLSAGVQQGGAASNASSTEPPSPDAPTTSRRKTLYLSDEDYRSLRSEDEEVLEELDEEASDRKKTRRGKAMERELERWVKG